MKRSSAYPRLAPEDDFRTETDHSKTQNEIIERIIKARELITGSNLSQLKLPSKRYRTEKFEWIHSKKVLKSNESGFPIVQPNNSTPGPSSETSKTTQNISKEAEKDQSVLNLSSKQMILTSSTTPKVPSFDQSTNPEKFSFELGVKRSNRDFDDEAKKPIQETPNSFKSPPFTGSAFTGPSFTGSPFTAQVNPKTTDSGLFSSIQENPKPQEPAKSRLFPFNPSQTVNPSKPFAGGSLFSPGFISAPSNTSSISSKFPVHQTPLFSKDSKQSISPNESTAQAPDSQGPKVALVASVASVPQVPQNPQTPQVFPVTSQKNPPLNPFLKSNAENQVASPFNPISEIFGDSLETKTMKQNTESVNIKSETPVSLQGPSGLTSQVFESKQFATSLFSGQFPMNSSLFNTNSSQPFGTSSILSSGSKPTELKNINYIPSNESSISKSLFHDVFKSSTFTSDPGSSLKKAKLTDEERISTGQYPDLDRLPEPNLKEENRSACLRKEFITSPSVSAALASGNLLSDQNKSNSLTGSSPGGLFEIKGHEKSEAKTDSLFANTQKSSLFSLNNEGKVENLGNIPKTGSLFGNNTTSTPFGTSPGFSGTSSLFSANPGSLFASNSGPIFGASPGSLFGTKSTSNSSGLFGNAGISIKSTPAPPVKLPSNVSNNPFFVQSSEKIDEKAFLEEEGYASGASGSDEEGH